MGILDKYSLNRNNVLKYFKKSDFTSFSDPNKKQITEGQVFLQHDRAGAGAVDLANYHHLFFGNVIPGVFETFS